MRSVKETFRFHRGSDKLTERSIYEHQPASLSDAIVVYSSATEDHNNLPSCSYTFVIDADAPLFEVSDEVLLVARNGQAGTMRVLSGKRFTINDHAYAMTVKEEAKNTVEPIFFMMAYQNAFFGLTTGKNSNGTFSKTIAEKIIITCPPIELQRNLTDAWRKQKAITRDLQTLLKSVQMLMERSVSVKHEKQFLVNDLFRVTSGVRITQREVYNNPGDCPVITSQTTSNGVAWNANAEWLGGFKKNGKRVLIEEPCITWTKDGRNAGKLFLRNSRFYPNDHAGVLIPMVPISLEWFVTSQQKVIYNHVTAKKSQGMLYEAQMANILINVPINPDSGEIDLCAQDNIAAEYRRLQSIESKLINLIGACNVALERIQQLAISLADPTRADSVPEMKPTEKV